MPQFGAAYRLGLRIAWERNHRRSPLPQTERIDARVAVQQTAFTMRKHFPV
jgi:hypothetical protein